MFDIRSATPAVTLDVLGRSCPYPIVLIKKEMEKLPGGSVIKILCDSQSTAEEAIPRYCEKHAYLFESAKLDDAGYWECYIQKT
jgi:tRNA 2-thiouridine synthesizing protein A